MHARVRSCGTRNAAEGLPWVDKSNWWFTGAPVPWISDQFVTLIWLRDHMATSTALLVESPCGVDLLRSTERRPTPSPTSLRPQRRRVSSRRNKPHHHGCPSWLLRRNSRCGEGRPCEPLAARACVRTSVFASRRTGTTHEWIYACASHMLRRPRPETASTRHAFGALDAQLSSGVRIESECGYFRKLRKKE